MDFYDKQRAIQWTRSSDIISNSPAGLEHLVGVNQLIVCQRFDLEVPDCLKSSKTYEVMNNQGQRIYFAEERNNWFLHHLCGISRPFTLKIYDNVGQIIITMHKALRCTCCWSSCCLQKLVVKAPHGEEIGYVCQYFHPFLPKFKIKNKNNKDIMKIRGPCLVSNCLWDLNFRLLSLEEEIVIGNISKPCTSSVGGSLTDADKFRVQFPMDLDIKSKALILGASFLIDYMYFEVWP
ncbi:PREDICTED: phospholipid scramblase 2 [Chinchilla lanigera]|uniref:Phospholipid scramblase n=1 Tax=Chinchilla lanigera TaxID=34839 RepID=A0A8C2VFP0_CHILA|nr:PREDICTED: phospholipid scramblase 2 [Chinchilla lanigera]